MKEQYETEKFELKNMVGERFHLCQISLFRMHILLHIHVCLLGVFSVLYQEQ